MREAQTHGVFIRVVDGEAVERIEVTEALGVGEIVTYKTGAPVVTEPNVVGAARVVLERIGTPRAVVRLMLGP